MEEKTIFKGLDLDDGTHVTIRAIQPEDAQIEWEFVHGLSKESRYFRFLSGLRDLSPSMVEYFTHIDFSKHMALIATVKDEDGEEKEIAVGRYFKEDNQENCEFAIVVDDKYQGKGIGMEISRLLIQEAKRKGYNIMEGEVAASNRKMLIFVKELGFKLEKDKEDSSLIHISMELNP